MPQEQSKLAMLVKLFNQLFVESENTRLQTGANEPFYRAPESNLPATIYSRDDYLSSALHEIAHWCIAGKKRRQVNDFGYWYKPEGRTQSEQDQFERVEIKPQAVEWALSLACRHPFHFSADNISPGIDASEDFKKSVRRQLHCYLNSSSLPARAQLLYEHLDRLFANYPGAHHSPTVDSSSKESCDV